MSTANTHLNLLNQFKAEGELAQPIHFEHIELSPPLVLAAALLYMMASDGEIKDAESSQLQSVLGGNDELISCAVSYVQSVPLDAFLQEAADSLSGLDKLCILTNVCDSFLADGSADPAELALFSRICGVFGFDEAAFEPYLTTIQLKNNKSALGPYTRAATLPGQGAVSNHLALAACIVYMMASDGIIGTEEIGRLQTAIGEFEGLQSMALKYVLKVKNAEFLREVVPTLNPTVKLLILTNVCDTLLSDGVVEPAEKKLFLSMLTAFGYSEKSFRTYYETLHIKNVKSFDLNDFNHSAAAQVFRSAKYQDSQAALLAAQAGDGEQLGTMIHRTMEDNIASVSHNAGGETNVHVMTDNANNRQHIQENIQHVEAGQREENIQYVDSALKLSENIQTLGHVEAALAENIQFVATTDTLSENIQRLPTAASDVLALSRMQWDIAQGEDGMAAGQGLDGLSETFQTGANAGMGVDEAMGKGGLTMMAQGEISFRERAMQNGQAVTQFTRSHAPVDAATLRSRLQALKQRNAEVEKKLTQLRSAQGLHAGTGGPAVPAVVLAKPRPVRQISRFQRLRLAVAQSVERIAKPRAMPGAYPDAALS